jgi:hypothetical protein
MVAARVQPIVHGVMHQEIITWITIMHTHDGEANRDKTWRLGRQQKSKMNT